MAGKVVRLSEETGQIIDRLRERMLAETGVELTKTQVVALALQKFAESIALATKQPGKAKSSSSVEKSTLR